jgi:hypothetical protein
MYTLSQAVTYLKSDARVCIGCRIEGKSGEPALVALQFYNALNPQLVALMEVSSVTWGVSTHLLDGVRSNVAKHGNLSRLAYAQHPSHRLLLDGRVPLRLNHVYVVRNRQVEPAFESADGIPMRHGDKLTRRLPSPRT